MGSTDMRWKFWEKRDYGMVDAEAILLKKMGAGEITVEEANQIPAYAASIDFIAGMVSGLPVKLYREDGVTTVEIRDDERLPLLNGYTGDMLGTGGMLRGMIKDYFDYGAGYAYVERTYNKPRALHYVAAKNVSALVNADPIFRDAKISIAGRDYKPYEFLRITRNSEDGVTGIGLPRQAATQLTTAYTALKYELRVLSSGGNKKGVLRSEKRLDETSMEKLREAWRQLYSSAESGAIVLNAGVDFKETSDTSVDLQINQNKITNTGEISRLFLLSPDVLSGGADADGIVNAVRTAVMPIILQLQDTMNDALLTEAEKRTMYFAFDTSELMRGDILKRYQAYQIALTSNFMQPDEVRYKEDMPPLGLNFIKLGLNDVLYDPETGTVYTPNTDKKTNIDGKEVKVEDEY